jgi:hypothetical protein
MASRLARRANANQGYTRNFYPAEVYNLLLEILERIEGGKIMGNKCKCGHEQNEHGMSEVCLHTVYGNFDCDCEKFQPCVEPELEMVRCPDRITCKYGGCEQHGDEHLPNDDCGTFGLDCPTCVPVKPEPPFDTGHPYDQSDLAEQLVPITAPIEPEPRCPTCNCEPPKKCSWCSCHKTEPVLPIKDRIVLTYMEHEKCDGCHMIALKHGNEANAQLPAIIARAKREQAREIISGLNYLTEWLEDEIGEWISVENTYCPTTIAKMKDHLKYIEALESKYCEEK